MPSELPPDLLIIELDGKSVPPICRDIDDEYARQASNGRATHLIDIEYLRALDAQQFVAIARNHPLEVWFAFIDRDLHHIGRRMPEDVHVTIAARFAGLEREPFLGRPTGEGITALSHFLFPAMNALDQRQPAPEVTAKIWRHGLVSGDLAAAVEEFTGQPVYKIN